MQAIAATVTAASPIQFVPAADPALRRDELGFTPGDVDEQQP
jgi:hypothetical protein